MTDQPKKPYKIGVTGGIACGKSLVRNLLDSLAIPTIDADEIVHNILQTDKFIINQIVSMFGSFILNEDGGINRKELAKVVFFDADKLRKLEAIIHPYTYRRVKDFISSSDSDIIAAIIPLLIENHRQYMFDSVWLVAAEEQKQVERLKLRDDISEDEAKQRIAIQMPQNLKMAMADVIIDNSGTIENVQRQVKEHIEEIRKKIS